MRKRGVCEDRDRCANWFVSVWQDAIAFKFNQSVLLAKFNRIREDKAYKRLTRYERSYCDGYQRCYQDYVVDRQFLEHGNWVRMPDGTEQWFGVAERVNKHMADINGIGFYHYIRENQIHERSGIYWVADGKRHCAPGQYPYFIPAIDCKS